MTRRGTNPTPSAAVAEPDDDWGDTEPMNSRAEHPLRAPAETWHSDPVESWHSLLAHRPKLAAQQPKPEPPGPPVDPRRPGAASSTTPWEAADVIRAADWLRAQRFSR